MRNQSRSGIGLRSLANLETSESESLTADFLEQITDRLGRILHIGLLKQHILLEEGIETTLDDLRDDLLRLAFGKGLLGGDAPLGLDDVLGNIVAG